MSSSPIISVQGLGKKYRIKHQAGRPRYTALRDVIADKAKGLFRWRRARGQQLGATPGSLLPVPPGRLAVLPPEVVMGNNLVREETEKLDALTSLRFFAALLVVLYHFGQTAIADWPCWLRGLSLNGYEAVTFFFILSGFVIAYNYLSNETDSGLRVPARSFWVARVARIYPVYLIALLIDLPPFAYSAFHANIYPVSKFLNALVFVPLMLQAWIPSLALAWNTPAWSLSVEAFFYSVFPSIAGRVARREGLRLLGLALGLVALSALCRQLAYAQGMVTLARYFPLFHLPSFLVGVALACCFRCRSRTGAGAYARVFWGSLAFVVALFALRTQLPNWLYNDLFMVPLFATMIWSAARANQRGSTLLSHPGLVRLGEASYALYILHMPLGFWFGWLVRNTLQVAHWENSWIAIMSFFVVSIAASLASYQWVETPCRRFLRCLLCPSLPAHGTSVMAGSPGAPPLT